MAKVLVYTECIYQTYYGTDTSETGQNCVKKLVINYIWYNIGPLDLSIYYLRWCDRLELTNLQIYILYAIILCCVSAKLLSR